MICERLEPSGDVPRFIGEQHSLPEGVFVAAKYRCFCVIRVRPADQRRGALGRTRWWVPFAPVRRYVDAPRDPHFGMTCKPIKGFCESKGATRMSYDAVVKSEAEHPRRILVDHALDSIFM